MSITGLLQQNRDQFLGLGAGLLSASGYSEQPISLGQALGRGMQGWQQGQQVADQRKRQSLYDQLQQKQSELAEKRVGISEQELAMRTQQAQQEAAQREAAGTAVSGLLGTPEQPTGLLSPAEAAWARANPQEYLSTRAQAEISNRNRAPSAFEQKLTAAGYQPGTPEYQAAARGLLNKPGQQINIGNGNSGPQFGTIPQGYMLIQDQGGYRMVPVPDGPAAREIEKERQTKETKGQQRKQYSDVVTSDIDRALKIVEGANVPVTGFGAYFASVPGTPARDLRGLVDTVRANVGFDRLQQMRDSSPTGGALGQVSELENRLLQATLGNLEQSQSEDQFVRNLKRVRDIHQRIIHEGIEGSEAEKMMRPYDGDEDIDSLINRYAP